MDCRVKIVRFVSADLIFELCDVFFLSRATASLVVTYALEVCSLFLVLVNGAKTSNSGFNGTFSLELILLSLVVILGVIEGHYSINGLCGWRDVGVGLLVVRLSDLVNNSRKRGRSAHARVRLMPRRTPLWPPQE